MKNNKYAKGEINLYIVNEILSIIAEHRQKNYSRVLTSFEYFGAGSQLYESLVNSDEFSCFEKEVDLFGKVIEEISKDFADIQTIQILDLGVGNGRKWINPFKFLSGLFNVEYVGIDISKNMLELAKKNFSGTSIKYHLDDFTKKSNLMRELIPNSDCRIISMLGNTICNFTDESKELKLLKEIQTHDNKPTFIIFGLELFSKNPQEILNEYLNELTKRIDSVPLDILNIDKTCGSIEIIFNEQKSQIEEWFHINSDTAFTPPYHTSQQLLKQGDSLLLSVTQKPTEKHLISKLMKVWDKTNIKLFQNNGMAIVVIYPDNLKNP